MQSLIEYLKSQKIVFSVFDQTDQTVVMIDGHTYELIYGVDGKLFDSDFHLLIDDKTTRDNYVFKFGGVYYYTPAGTEDKPQLNRLRFLGHPDNSLPTPSFLGIRGGYELLNGVNLYDQWIQKAKFLNTEVLGICEKNTLAGALKFQIECIKNKIRPIIGATYTVQQSEDYKYDVKCFVMNETGWTNLLLMNTEVNVINQKFIPQKRFFELTEGLRVIFDPKSIDFERMPRTDMEIMYQLDTVDFDDEEHDLWYLKNLQKFVRRGWKPISITDAFYINREDAYLKVKLNQISGVQEFKSTNQYFKSKEEYFDECDMLFKNDDRSAQYAITAMNNEAEIVKLCQFTIPQEGKHLPVYKMTDAEKVKFETNEDLFWDLILRGLQKKVPKDKHSEYLERIDEEVEVIELGGFIDYFLILWDIIKWSNLNGILSGFGRGSVGGSLIAYLLNITRLDPIEFGLLFSRFLNKGRVEGGSLPDIDTDVSGSQKDRVKQYMESKYGIHQVCSVGTYTTLQVKAAIKDLARLYNIPPQDVNWITTSLEDEDENVTGIFKNALRSPKIMAFIQEYTELINDAIALLKQPKSASIHACATIILPDDNDLFHWIPVKNMSMKDGTSCLVSEWEGGELDAIGLLKEDILGIKQLDKIQLMLDLIKQNRGTDLDIYNLPYDDEIVYRYFRKGWTQDVFHFGAKGLTGYCKQSQPETIDDLIAAIALYRPGPIESNLHNEYVLRKTGEREVEYLWGTDEITRDTQGILCYQEQIMKTCVDVGGFSLIESDDVRRGMGKKKQEVIDSYRVRFIEGAVKNGCPLEEAENTWSTMEKFAGYAFNKSHAAAYSITGYICNYLKAHYPIEFWTAAFMYVDPAKREEKIPQFIAEINATGSIKLSPPDINYSEAETRSEYKLNTIYWALSSVKQVGGIATDQIMQDRNKDGNYFNFEEFLSRHTFKGSKVNKSTIENLIYAGAFDQIESLENSMQRKRLLDFFRAKNKVKIKDEKDLLTSAGNLIYEEWWWDLQQRQLSGLARFDYREICDKYLQTDFRYLEQEDYQSPNLQAQYYGLGGYILEVIERETKKKGKYCSMRIESNSTFLWVTIFPEQYKQLTSAGLQFVGAEGSLLILTGMIKMDDFKKENVCKIWDNSEVVLLS